MVGSLKDDITRGGGGLTGQSRGVGEDGFLIGLLKRSGRKISLLSFFCFACSGESSAQKLHDSAAQSCSFFKTANWK